MISDCRNRFIVSVLETERSDGFGSVEVGFGVFGNTHCESVIKSLWHGVAIGDPVEGALEDFGGREASREISKVGNTIAPRGRISDMSEVVKNAVR